MCKIPKINLIPWKKKRLSGNKQHSLKTLFSLCWIDRDVFLKLIQYINGFKAYRPAFDFSVDGF